MATNSSRTRFYLAFLLVVACALAAPQSARAYTYTQATLTTSADSPAIIEAIPLQATAIVSPPGISIQVLSPGTFSIYRKSPEARTWGSPLATGVALTLSSPGTSNVWKDTNVTVGATYEYQFVNTAASAYTNVGGYPIYPTGYIIAGIQVDQTQPKGLFGVVVASDLPVNLPAEYAQYKADLIADGWQVREIQVPRAANYNGVGNAGIASVTVTQGGTSSLANNAAVTFTADSSGAKAYGTVSVTSNVITRVSFGIGGGIGAGFVVGDTLTISGGSVAGTGAQLTAVSAAGNLTLTSATPISGGSGYTNNATVTMTGQTSGATTTAVIHTTGTNGTISFFTITGNQAGFTSGETLVMSGNATGSGVGRLTANVFSGNLSSISLTPPGSGYLSNDNGILTGVTSGKTAQVSLFINANGAVTGVKINSSDQGFTAGEQLTLSGTSSGSGAPPFNGTYGGTLTSVNITAGGSGYVNGATVLLTYGSASAQGVLTVTSGAITSVAISNATSGFISGGTLTIQPYSANYKLTVATLDNSFVGHAVQITSGGSGYQDNDSVTIKGNTSGATTIGSLIAPAGSVTGISVVLPNTFTAGEGLTITPTLGGNGAAATAGPSLEDHLLIRGAVQAIYNAFPGRLKNITMVGKVPVARSGIDDFYGSDGHGNEAPYGVDAFYADMDGVVGTDWTDTGSNTTDVYTNVNLPGDKQFDQQKISAVGNGVVELGFGRIDLSLSINTEVEAERNYFNKLHRYKTASPDFLPGFNVCDRLSYANEREADLQSMPGVVGINNINFIPGTVLPTVQAGQDSDQLYSTLTGPYLFYFKGSGGPGQGINGKAVFWTGMQSHWGYWYQSSLVSSGANDMQLRLAENSFTLDFTWNIWGMRYIYHRMGMGYDAGDMMKTSINNQGWTTGPYTYRFNNTSNGDFHGSLYMNQMGDPALRLFMFAPPTALSVVKTNGNPNLTWAASTAAAGFPIASPAPLSQNFVGYHVYRAPYMNGAFTRLTTVPIAATTFADTSVSSGSYVYMVRAVELQTSGGGSFYNPSLGATGAINLDVAPSSVTIVTASLPQANWNTAYTFTLAAQGGTPQYLWSIANGTLPSGLTLSSAGTISGTTSAIGSFPVTFQAQDQNGQTATAQLTLAVNQNMSGLIYPEQTSYTSSGSPTTSFGTTETAAVTGPVGTAETFHRYDLSSVNANNGIAKATVFLYVTSNTAAGLIAPVQANLIADSADGWIANGISKFFTGVSNNGSGKTRVNCPAHGFVTGTSVTLAGLAGTGAPTGPYSITVVDGDNFDIPVTYSSSWTYDPALSYATTASMTYNTRPTSFDAAVPTMTAAGNDTPGQVLQVDVTAFVRRALTFPSKKMGLRFFTGTQGQTVFTGTLNSFGNSVPYLLVQSSNAPSITVNSPSVTPANVNLGSSIYLSTTVTAIPANQANLTVQWTQISGPGGATFTSPNSASTGVTFTTPGSYDLRITANDEVESSTQDIFVNVLGVGAAGPPDSMVLRLPFDETSGTTAFDGSGVSPANNGTLSATPAANPVATWTNSGMINGALSFNGAGQSVVVNDSTTNQLDGQHQMAISLWFNAGAFPASSTTYAALICKRFAAFNHESFTMNLRGGNATAATMYWDFNTSVGGTSATSFGLNKWYHIVMQFDGTTTTNNVQFWVNGNPDRFYSNSATTVNRNPTANVHIGALDATDTGGFTGIIDEVRIYNRLLTPTEIQALASAVPSNLGPVITTTPTLSGNVGQPLALTATVADDGKPSGSLTYSWGQLSGPSSLTITNSSTLNASTTPGTPGSYALFMTASDGAITTFANVSATITGQTYATWATANGLSGAAAAPTAINANDGLNNFFKYALGLHATTTYQPGAAGLPVISTQSSGGKNYLTLSFNGVATDVTYSVQHSSDLINWTPIQTFPSGGTPPGQTTVQDPISIGAADKEFLRLLMSNP